MIKMIKMRPKKEIRRKLEKIARDNMVSIDAVMQILEDYVVWRKRKSGKNRPLSSEERKAVACWTATSGILSPEEE